MASSKVKLRSKFQDSEIQKGEQKLHTLIEQSKKLDRRLFFITFLVTVIILLIITSAMSIYQDTVITELDHKPSAVVLNKQLPEPLENTRITPSLLKKTATHVQVTPLPSNTIIPTKVYTKEDDQPQESVDEKKQLRDKSIKSVTQLRSEIEETVKKILLPKPTQTPESETHDED